jgi:hypothetical protein
MYFFYGQQTEIVTALNERIAIEHAISIATRPVRTFKLEKL